MNKEKINWYDNVNCIINYMIVTILLIVVCSQSFVLGDNLSFKLFSSIVNHNSVYLFVLIYFVSIKFKFGKKYFNYLNLILIFIYFIVFFTSILTVIQAFSISSVLDFLLDSILFISLSHTFLRNTRIWKDFNLGSSPFNQISNDNGFYSLVVISIISLIINLISTVVVSGLLISFLDTIYFLIFGRYIYLYRKYLDLKKIDSDNSGNFDNITSVIIDNVDATTNKIKDIISEEKLELFGLNSNDNDESIINKEDDSNKNDSLNQKNDLEKIDDSIINKSDDFIEKNDSVKKECLEKKDNSSIRKKKKKKTETNDKEAIK